MAAPITNIASGIKLNQSGGLVTPSSAQTASLMTANLRPKGALQPSGQYVTPRPTTPYTNTQSNSSGMSIPEYQAAVAAKSQPQVQAGVNQSTPSPYTPYTAPQAPTTQPTGTTKGVLTYPGLVGSLTQNSLTGSPLAGTAGKGLMGATDQNALLSQRAEDVRNLYGGKIAEVGRLGAGAVAGDLSTGTNVVGSGNANLAANAASSRMSALAADENANLGAIDRQLTAQGQTQNALTSAGSLGNTAQGQLQSGLTSAANLAQPSGNFPFAFNPLTGQFSNASGGSSAGTTLTYNPQQDAQTLADAVINHQISLADAQSSLGYAGTVANGLLNSAILAKGGNPTILQTQAGIQNEQEGQAQAYQSAHQQAANLQAQLTDLITKFGLNPSDLNAANTGIQLIAKNTSDPRYQILNNYLADVASRYSQILTPPGGSATDTTRSVAAGMLNGVASGNSIISVLQSLDQQAQAVSAGVRTIGTGGSSSTSGSSSGSSEGWY